MGPQPGQGVLPPCWCSGPSPSSSGWAACAWAICWPTAMPSTTSASLGEPWSVNSLAQVAGVYCLRQMEYMERTRERIPAWRDKLVQLLQGLGLESIPSQTNLVLAQLPASGPTASQVAEACAAGGVLVRDCANFVGCTDRDLRLTVCDPDHLPRLEKALGAALAG